MLFTKPARTVGAGFDPKFLTLAVNLSAKPARTKACRVGVAYLSRTVPFLNQSNQPISLSENADDDISGKV